MSKGNKQRYIIFSDSHPLPLFFQPWWLDSACAEGEWDVCLSQDKSGGIRGVLPYYLTTRYGFRLARMPLLTPYLGVWFCYPEGLSNTHSRVSFEREVTAELIGQLPRVAYYEQHFLPSFTDWLPFYWQGFSQQTFYTYQFSPTSDTEALFSGLKSNVRNKIRKARKEVRVEESDSPEECFRLLELTFRRRRKKMPFSFVSFSKLDAVLKRKGRRKIYLAKDGAGHTHGAIYLAWDDSCMYNLALGVDSEYMQSGASPLLLWQGITDAMEAGLAFDFEGSMISGVEQLFRSFGARQTPYFTIFKGRNKLFEAGAHFFKKRF